MDGANSSLISPLQYNPEADAKALRKAMKGLGTDEDGLINVLAHRKCEQRIAIKEKYYSMYGKKLEDAIKSETSGNFCKILRALLMDRVTLSAYTLYKAMKGAGTDEKTLINVLCPASNSEIKGIKVAYREVLDKEGVKNPSRSLESDLQSELSGCFRRIMLSVVQANRDESFTHDTSKYSADVKDIYDAGQGRLGTDEETFIRIFASRSPFHLHHLSKYYHQQTGKTLLAAIKSEISGDFCAALSLILSICEDYAGTFAEMLNKCVRGLGTDDDTLIYIIVTQCEIELKQIAKVYRLKYGKSLADDIRGDTSGNYRKTLLALLGEAGK